MERNLNLKLKKTLTIMLGIIFVLSITVIYQWSSINKIKNKQTTEFFLEMKLTRDQANARDLQSLKALIDDENTPKVSRAIAASKYINIANSANNEVHIEMILKSKGYDEVVAFISDDRVRVILNHNKKLSNKQLKEISDTVFSVTKIKDIEVTTK